MKQIRLAITAMVYLFIVCVYGLGASWVFEGVEMDVNNKTGVLFFGVLWFGICTFIIEVHESHSQGLRDDFIDAVLPHR